MSPRFEIQDLPLAGLKCILRKPLGDDRGHLERMFCSEELRSLIEGRNIEQINHTLTRKRGAVRGLHFQRPPHAEVKFVACLRGEVFDVAVDLRPNSPTFLQWRSVVLSPQSHKTFLIPEGFAHGFQALTADCEMLYFHTRSYHEESEGGLNAKDPRLEIRWPLDITERSGRDEAFPMIDENFKGVML